MKTVIFAGGLGSRISEESHLRPKPMIEIGGKPILWHIMKIYQAQGFNDFVICLGYKGYIIKEYFINYFYHNADITVDLATNQVEVHQVSSENFKVTLVDTGENTLTAGRLKQVRPYIQNEDFMLTYGDGLADIDLKKLREFHQSHGKVCSVTAVQPAGKFGMLNSNESGLVQQFVEKPKTEGGWINGGFFMLSPRIFDYLDRSPMNNMMWEDQPMRDLVADNELMSFKHYGFWKCMDIMRDKVELEKMWETVPKWKNW